MDVFLFMFLSETKSLHKSLKIKLAEGVGFEPTDRFNALVSASPRAIKIVNFVLELSGMFCSCSVVQ